ncbi:MAG: type II and III secretion system family protein [Alphaproteobacteria bacterium]|nr:type II and III secretion system family protein [Alphaproteobacteria bacterium]
MSDRIGYRNKFARSLALMTGVACTGLMATGCDLARNQLKADRASNMEFQDYRDGLAPRIPSDTDLAWASEGEAGADEGIPALQPYIAQPADNLKPMPLVSISVNQTVPLRDALFEMAEQAEYDIELDPRISGSIIFTAREKPFDTVIKRISEIAGLRYKFEDDSLRVELDTPYHETYKIDYLSYIRSNTSSIRNDVSVVAGGGTNTGSKFEAAANSEADFWGELETNLGQILGVGPTSGNLRTANDPQITAVSQNPNVEAVTTVGEDGQPVVQVQPPQTTLQVSSLPTEVNSVGDPNAPTQQGGGQGPSFATNKQAGVVSIYATERQHEKIREYLKELRRSVTAQVLIEAKILEVSLTDEFAAGIDWSQVDLLSGELTFGFDSGNSAVIGGARPDLTPAVGNPASNFRIGYSGNDIGAIVDAVSRFGTVHALASPRLTVLNNQSAVLNVANNQVYFEIDIDVTTTDNSVQTNIDSDIRNVPEGVLINVQPSIDLDARTVSMAVRPTVTRITSFVNDPSIQFVTAQNNITGVQSQVPVVNVQEMDSVVSMNSGQAIVMGGLMQDRSSSTQQGVPVLAEIPIFGAAFRNQNDKIQKTELVVFLKATIIDGANGTVHQTDKDLYNKFSNDRRPLDL